MSDKTRCPSCGQSLPHDEPMEAWAERMGHVMAATPSDYENRASAAQAQGAELVATPLGYVPAWQIGEDEVAQEPPAPPATAVEREDVQIQRMLDDSAQIRTMLRALEAQRGEMAAAADFIAQKGLEWVADQSELTAARDLAAQLWAVVRAADAMRDQYRLAARIAGGNLDKLWSMQDYDTLRAALKDSNG